MPRIDRNKISFPLNLQDFLYPDGVRVLSKHEIKTWSKFGSTSILDQAPFLCPFQDLMYKTNANEKELIMTNQEGKLFYATCLEYFVDITKLEHEFKSRGIMDYSSENKIVNQIHKVRIPDQRYFISFNMCIISLKSYKF